MTETMRRHRLQVIARGIVQGVGFRPLVHRIASRAGLSGFVQNNVDHVLIELEGPARRIDDALANIQREALQQGAHFESWKTTDLAFQGDGTFKILPSEPLLHSDLNPAPVFMAIQKDLSPCPECWSEFWDPSHRRYQYAFVSCATCGPRYSVLKKLPFDRDNTTYAAFPPCQECDREYRDPTDRRFHAQTISCGRCGPRWRHRLRGGDWETSQELPTALLVSTLKSGWIWGIKTSCGFQLVAWATHPEVNDRLRRIKHRPRKPFVVMVSDIAQAQTLAKLTAAEEEILQSSVRPILLCSFSDDPPPWLRPLIPTGERIGLMLPSHPVYAAVLKELPGPLVVTSLNRADDPLIIDEETASMQFGNQLDGILSHTLVLRRGLDDSIVQLVGSQPQVLRLGRGLAPWSAHQTGDDSRRSTVAALGSTLKNAVALISNGGAILSQHIGNLDSLASLQKREEVLSDIIHLLQVKPQVWAIDRHPAASPIFSHAPLLPIQHHAAHIAAVAVEHKLSTPLVGVAWDGFGLGDDHGAWGGEFYQWEHGTPAPRRVASILPFPLLGGDQAARHPYRCLAGLLWMIDPDPALFMFRWHQVLHLSNKVPAGELQAWVQLLISGTNSPLTSSIGRLFDGIAALMGFPDTTQYEGEAASWLTDLAVRSNIDRMMSGAWLDPGSGGLPRWDWRPLLRDLLREHQHQNIASLAYSFHTALAATIVEWATQQQSTRIILSGGAMQNRLLLDLCLTKLQDAGIVPFVPLQIPPGDGGLALGQAVLAAHQQPPPHDAPDD